MLGGARTGHIVERAKHEQDSKKGPLRHRWWLQVCVRCEEINISGGMVRQKMKYERFLNKRMNTNPRRAAYKFRAPSRILWRTVRGCAPGRGTGSGAAGGWRPAQAWARRGLGPAVSCCLRHAPPWTR